MNAGDVMTKGVVTVTPETPITDIVTLLLARGVSGVPVVAPGGDVVGVVTEGDLLRRAELGTQKHHGAWRTFFMGSAVLAKEYVRSHGLTARDVMTATVISVTPDAPLSAVADLMEERRIKRVPVLESGRLAGVVSRANLLRALVSTLQETPAAPGGDAAIRNTLQKELSQQPWSRRADNSVVVSDGVVHLWGLVGTADELRALELAARSVPGVKAVKSHMIVLAEEPPPLFSGSILT